MIHVEASEARERPLRVGAGRRPAANAEAAAMDRPASDRRDGAEERIAALGEMTGGVAHDFRNILATIDAALRLAERKADDPAAVRRFIAGARAGVEQGTRLISQLLAFAARQEVETDVADVNALLRSLAPFLDYAAGPGIRITFTLAPELPPCRVEKAQFGAAVLNLVVNARDAMPDGGEVRIETARCGAEAAGGEAPPPGGWVCVRVADQGPGMPADTVERIFDPFFTTKGEKGSGLGLPHVSNIMRRMGGAVSVRSAPGEGTVFELLFRAGDHASSP